MKHIIERLKEEVKQPTCKLLQKVCAYISIDDAQKIIEFYESTVKESGLTEDEFQNGGYTDAEINCNSGCMGSIVASAKNIHCLIAKTLRQIGNLFLKNSHGYQLTKAVMNLLMYISLNYYLRKVFGLGINCL